MTAATLNRRANASADAGFTLLELLVTFAILASVSTLLLGAMVSVRHVSLRMIADASSNSDVGAAQNLLRSRVENLRAVPRTDRVTPVVDLQGSEQVLKFFAPPFDSGAPSSLQAFQLVRMATGDLMLFSAPALAEDVDLRSPSLTGWKPTRLLGGVNELSLAYFGPGPNAAIPQWQQLWRDREQPPELVRIGVRFADGDRRSWPDLVIRPAVTMNTACRIDPISARCANGGAR